MADHLTPKPAKKKILVVDDDAKIRGLLREILSTMPCQVLEAEDGKEALEIVHKDAVDLIITDRAMQRMDGLELLKKLREENSTIPTLMISAYGDEDLWASAVGLGAEDYILKPFSSESVMKVVKKKLG